MNWIAFIVPRLHVLLGITWFGYSLALAIFFIPASSSCALGSESQPAVCDLVGCERKASVQVPLLGDAE